MQPTGVLSVLAPNDMAVAGLLLAAGAVLVAVLVRRRRRQEDRRDLDAGQVARSYGRWTTSYGYARSGGPQDGDGRGGPDDAPRAVGSDAASRVLIVEDDDSVRELCEQTLADEGYEVVAAASAEEAIACFGWVELLAADGEVHDPGITILEVGVVITDLELPGMSGADLARELTARDPDVPVLFTSGYDPSDFGVDPETAAFLPKPFTPGQLLRAVRSAGTRRHAQAAVRDGDRDADGVSHLVAGSRFLDDGTPIRPRVLVVEDDDSVRALCELILADEGYEVVTADSGREALELVATLDGLDLLVSDLNSSSTRDTTADIVLPGTDRVTLDELLAACRWNNLQHDGEADGRPPVEDEIAGNDAGGRPATGDAGIGVLLMSGHAAADVGVAPDELAFLSKPFTPQELMQAVRSARTHAGSGTPRSGWTQVEGPFRFSRRDGGPGSRPADGTALVGFGTFTVSRNRLAAVTATAGVAILIAGGMALAVGARGQVGTKDTPAVTTIATGDGTPDDRAADSQPAAAPTSNDPSAEDADPDPTSGTTGSRPEPSPQLAAEPDPQTPLDVDSDPEQQSSSEPQPVQEPSPDPSSESSPDPSPESTPESSTEPEPAVAYSAPSKDAPVLVSCSSQGQADGTTTYTVQFSVRFSGGDYDVLPHEPFVNNDETVQVRGGTLTWNVTATHVGQRGDGDTFDATAPSEFGWADPGSDDRSHAYLPPALTVYADRCGH